MCWFFKIVFSLFENLYSKLVYLENISNYCSNWFQKLGFHSMWKLKRKWKQFRYQSLIFTANYDLFETVHLKSLENFSKLCIHVHSSNIAISKTPEIFRKLGKARIPWNPCRNCFISKLFFIFLANSALQSKRLMHQIELNFYILSGGSNLKLSLVLFFDYIVFSSIFVTKGDISKAVDLIRIKSVYLYRYTYFSLPQLLEIVVAIIHSY